MARLLNCPSIERGNEVLLCKLGGRLVDFYAVMTSSRIKKILCNNKSLVDHLDKKQCYV